MQNQKILLLNPPFTRSISRDYVCPHSYKSDYSWPAIDLVAISGILSEFSLHYVDEIKEKRSVNAAIENISKINPTVIFMLVSSISEKEDLAFIAELKKISAARIAVLGDIVSFESERLASYPDIDYLILDFTNKDAIRAVAGGNRNEKIIGFIETTDFSIGVPRHEIFRKYDYYYPYSLYNHVAQLLTSYGCPYSCRFCNAGTLGYKTRKSAEILGELHYLAEIGVKEIYFKDFTFLGAPNKELLELMIRNRFNFAFSCNLRIDAVDADFLVLLKKAGCYLVFYGLESGSFPLRSHAGKGFDNAKIRAVLDETRRVGIETLCSYIIGFPDETAADINETIRLIFDSPPDYLSVNVLVARHGSEIREELNCPDLEDLDNSRSKGMVATDGKSIDTIRKSIEQKFYFQPLRLIKLARLACKSQFRLQRSFKSFMSMIDRIR